MSRWAAVLDGVSGQANFTSVTASNNVDIDMWVKFTINQTGGLISDGGTGQYFRFASNTLRFRCTGFLGNSKAFTPTLNQQYKLSVRIRSTSVELLVDDVSIGSDAGSPTSWTIDTIGMYNTSNFSGITVERVTITDNTTSTNSRDFLNEVVAGSSTNWPDVSGNGGDATLNGTATDGSQWELVGGGPTFQAAWAINANKLINMVQ